LSDLLLMKMNERLGPQACGFNGAKGIRLPGLLMGCQRLQLKRGKQSPKDYPDTDFREQLVWFYPDDQHARLLWCNADDQWFELSFSPIGKP
jgi:hypothetical protein